MKPYQLDKKRRITHDGLQFIIQKKVTNKKSKEGFLWQATGYYPSCQSLLTDYFHSLVGESTLELKEALHMAVTEVKQHTEKLANP